VPSVFFIVVKRELAKRQLGLCNIYAVHTRACQIWLDGDDARSACLDRFASKCGRGRFERPGHDSCFGGLVGLGEVHSLFEQFWDVNARGGDIILIFLIFTGSLSSDHEWCVTGLLQIYISYISVLQDLRPSLHKLRPIPYRSLPYSFHNVPLNIL
jgi:hypothetical protein